MKTDDHRRGPGLERTFLIAVSNPTLLIGPATMVLRRRSTQHGG